ncbi:MAG: hypothetical protein ACOYBY_01060 [Dermatophilaceae bacterium]
MGILAVVPFDPRHPDAPRLLHVLNATMGSKAKAKSTATRSGVPEAQVDWDGPMVDVWPRLLLQASVLGRLRALINEVATVISDEPFLKQLLEQPDAPADDGDDLFQTPLLWDDEPMIDRADLRATVKKMLGKNSRRALLVTGSDCVGKTQTQRFISYLAENGQVGQVLPVDNSRRAGAPIDVPELAQWIASTLLGADAPSFDEYAQSETLVKRFWGWLTYEAGRLPASVWLLFDGFTNTTATAAAMALVTDITRAAADRKLGTIRVAVLGFTGSADLIDGALCDTLRQPTDDEVRAFFARLALLVRKQQLSPAVINGLFDTFVAQGGTVDRRPLRELGPTALALAIETYGAPL